MYQLLNIGEFHPIRNTPGHTTVLYGVVIQVGEIAVIGLSLPDLYAEYGRATRRLLRDREIIAEGRVVRLLGYFQDTGQGNGDNAPAPSAVS